MLGAPAQKATFYSLCSSLSISSLCLFPRPPPMPPLLLPHLPVATVLIQPNLLLRKYILEIKINMKSSVSAIIWNSVILDSQYLRIKHLAGYNHLI